MKTWRERIAEARERGAFTEEDRELASRGSTCAVGEAALSVGRDHEWYISHDHSTVCHSGQFTISVRADDIAGAEQTLDAIEDRVLALKRESAT